MGGVKDEQINELKKNIMTRLLEPMSEILIP